MLIHFVAELQDQYHFHVYTLNKKAKLTPDYSFVFN